MNMDVKTCCIAAVSTAATVAVAAGMLCATSAALDGIAERAAQAAAEQEAHDARVPVVPVAIGVATPEDEAVAMIAEHVVVEGDTLWDLSQREGCEVSDWMAANESIEDAHWIYVGDVLAVPAR